MIDDLVQTRLTFEVPAIPPSVNRLYGRDKNGRKYLIADAIRFRDALCQIARTTAGRQGWHYRKGRRLKIVFTYTFATNRTIDLDNLLKLSLDALKTALGFDDNRRVVAEVTARDGGVDKHNPHCEVTIETL